MSAVTSRRPVQALLVGLFASPAAGLWLATGSSRRDTVVRILAIVSTVLAALALLHVAMRRETASILWASWVVCGSVAAYLLAMRIDHTTSPADSDATTAGPRHVAVARREVVGALLAAFAAPPVVLLVRLVAAAVVGRLLVRLNPGSLDPGKLFESIALGCLWAAPAAALFAVVSIHRGHLATHGDVGRATVAWAAFLAVFEVVVIGSLRLLRSQSLPADMEVWPQTRDLLVQAGIVIGAVPLALHVAWGHGRLLVRLASLPVLVIAATLNLGLLVGLTAETQFALARLAERSTRLEDAIKWYARTLTARATPLRESYLQHRIGLLHYKLDRVDKARDAFRLVQTTRDAHAELVRESAWYLQRLEQRRDGSRIVLPGVEQRTEYRSDYCAPNSLALVLGYWGRPLSASEIGQEIAYIGGGTSGPDIPLFCAQRGFDHLLIPFATRADVEWLLEQKLPVLLYIPGHVLAVFGSDRRLDTWVAYDTATWDIWVDWPVEYLQPEWGEDLFVVGLVLPRADQSPAVTAARERFDQPAARATFHWWRAASTDDPEQARRLLRAAIMADPGFFPAALDLATPENRPWLTANADIDRLTVNAREFIRREHAPVWSIGPQLAEWLVLFGRDRELLEFAAELEQRGLLDSVRSPAARAAVRLGEWERASQLLSEVEADEDDDDFTDLCRARFRTEVALGRTAAATDAGAELAGTTYGDEREQALRAALELGADRGPVFQANLLSLTRPEDTVGQLDYAEATLKAGIAEPTSRRQRTQWARRTVTQVLALAQDEPTRARARALLTQIEEEIQR